MSTKQLPSTTDVITECTSNGHAGNGATQPLSVSCNGESVPSAATSTLYSGNRAQPALVSQADPGQASSLATKQIVPGTSNEHDYTNPTPNVDTNDACTDDDTGAQGISNYGHEAAVSIIINPPPKKKK